MSDFSFDNYRFSDFNQSWDRNQKLKTDIKIQSAGSIIFPPGQIMLTKISSNYVMALNAAQFILMFPELLNSLISIGQLSFFFRMPHKGGQTNIINYLGRK